MHGPLSMKSSPVDRALLEVTRPMMIVAALLARRPSLMASPEWSAASLTTPNEDSQSFPSLALPSLWDALAQIPALYHERDTILSLQLTKPSNKTTGSLFPLAKVRALLSRSLKLRDDMIFQRYQLKASHPDSDFASIPLTAIPSTQQHPCMVVTHFSSLQAANTFTLYNALIILIGQFIMSVYLLLPASDVDIALKKSISEQISTATMAILKSVDYHMLFTEVCSTSISGTSGKSNFCLLLPIQIAQRVLSQSQSPSDITKKLWLEDVLHCIKSRAGPWMSNNQIFGVKKSLKYQAKIN
jgi:hypothetical protein